MEGDSEKIEPGLFFSSQFFAVSGTFKGVVLPRGRSRNCLRVRMRGRGWGVMWGCGGGFCCSAPQYGWGRGGEEGHTQEHTHTHTQERTRKCCTYPLATYPLKSALLFTKKLKPGKDPEKKRLKPGKKHVRKCGIRRMLGNWWCREVRKNHARTCQGKNLVQFFTGLLLTDPFWRTKKPRPYLPREKPGSIFHWPPPHRPLLAGADSSSKCSLEPTKKQKWNRHSISIYGGLPYHT